MLFSLFRKLALFIQYRVAPPLHTVFCKRMIANPHHFILSFIPSRNDAGKTSSIEADQTRRHGGNRDLRREMPLGHHRTPHVAWNSGV